MPLKILFYNVIFLLNFSIEAKMLTACIDHYPPLQVLAEKPYGESISALKALAKVINYEIEFVTGPNFARCLKLLELGQVDILAGLVDNPKRREIAHLISYKKDTQYIFITRADENDIESYQDLKQQLIGVTENTLYFEQFDNDSSLKKVPVKDIKIALRMLIKDRIDIVITAQEILNSLLSELNIQNQIKVNAFTYGLNRNLNFGISKLSHIHLSKIEIAKIKLAAQEGLFVKVINQFIAEHPELY
ncbi:transporter substrate-binding domain-containing protein [Pseudoalteromonas denitrificans]|uniref:Extracellular solute-binding protein, family 3 n=1 Tax=Pseudoalteromonas denitrificans DSM 6059 TaxID=1123010 RepID=A0A1I1GT23_9GAMM|nr:transporter substrate-binding domain-containing protein [Pseudoalteromonas denitrificans]SFC12180.1 extracellular solute-binding protein, family 3 [Pseudoalteromonas denitrificans DSM 6059]